jgi:hypothetical protein
MEGTFGSDAQFLKWRIVDALAVAFTSLTR